MSLPCILDEKFDPKKIITIQDPKSPGRRTRHDFFRQANQDISAISKKIITLIKYIVHGVKAHRTDKDNELIN
jgi:hypothetical protein